MSAADGTKVAVVPEHVTVPGIETDPCFNVNVDEVTVPGFIVSLKTADKLVPVAADTELFAGTTELIKGAVTSGATPAVVKFQL